jgi:hypothetical protein
MMRASTRLAAVIVVIWHSGLLAQAPVPVSFKFERPVVVDGAGPRRLAIDVPLLTGSNPFRVVSRTTNPTTGEISAVAVGGLSDLRFFDASGNEVGHLLVQPPSAEPEWKQAEILPIAPVETDKQKTSGFEADLGQAYAVDRLRVDGLKPPFLKRVRLEGSGDRAHWTLLAAEGTLFDLPQERLHQLDVAFTAGSFRYLRLTWDDTRSGRLPLPPAVRARMAAQAPAAPGLTAAVAFERRPNEPGSSRFRIRLPAARLPIVALDLEVGGGHVLRHASVEEARMRGGEVVPVAIGEATLRRVVHDDVAAAALRIPIESPAESVVDLIVSDGDNPPLDLRRVTAVFATLPWIYLETSSGDLVARYGNATLGAPRYDLEAARDKLHIESVTDAKWADARTRAADETTGGTPPALPTTGAPLDISEFKYIRSIPSGDAGLLVVPLDPAALAHTLGPVRQFADVRIIDSLGRQVPFLIERPSEPLSIDVSIERSATIPKALATTSNARSVYRIRLPIDRLPPARLVLTTSARVFDRRISVAVERAPSVRRRDAWIETIAGTHWVHTDQDRPTPELTLRLEPLDTNELLVVVDEGDNSPLPIGSARLLLPAYRLRLYRERGASLRLAYGRPDLAAPRYDLALLAPQVLGVTATEVSLGAEQAGPAAAAAATISPRIFWIILALAVLVLLTMIVRLVGKPNEADVS